MVRWSPPRGSTKKKALRTAAAAAAAETHTRRFFCELSYPVTRDNNLLAEEDRFNSEGRCILIRTRAIEDQQQQHTHTEREGPASRDPVARDQRPHDDAVMQVRVWSQGAVALIALAVGCENVRQ